MTPARRRLLTLVGLGVLAVVDLGLLVWAGRQGWWSLDDFQVMGELRTRGLFDAGLEERLKAARDLVRYPVYLLVLSIGGTAHGWAVAMLIAIRLGVAALIYRLGRTLELSLVAAVVGALVWLFAPPLFRSNLWLSQVTQPLCLLFCLANLQVATRFLSAPTRGRLVLFVVTEVLAMITHEHGTLLPGLQLLVFFALPERPPLFSSEARRLVLPSAGLLLLVAGYRLSLPADTQALCGADCVGENLGWYGLRLGYWWLVVVGVALIGGVGSGDRDRRRLVLALGWGALGIAPYLFTHAVNAYFFAQSLVGAAFLVAMAVDAARERAEDPEARGFVLALGLLPVSTLVYPAVFFVGLGAALERWVSRRIQPLQALRRVPAAWPLGRLAPGLALLFAVWTWQAGWVEAASHRGRPADGVAARTLLEETAAFLGLEAALADRLADPLAPLPDGTPVPLTLVTRDGEPCAESPPWQETEGGLALTVFLGDDLGPIACVPRGAPLPVAAGTGVTAVMAPDGTLQPIP